MSARRDRAGAALTRLPGGKVCREMRQRYDRRARLIVDGLNSIG